MKVVKLAAGLAVGYVLGSRAGRDKYEQIVDTVRKASGRPSRQEAPADLTGGPVTVTAPASAAPVPESTPPVRVDGVVPRPPRRKPAVTTPGAVTAPLA